MRYFKKSPVAELRVWIEQKRGEGERRGSGKVRARGEADKG